MAEQSDERGDERGDEQGDERGEPQSGAEAGAQGFDALFAPLVKPVFTEIARTALAGGADATGEARSYAERGKPDFALAYLLAAPLSDDEKRDALAHAFERRAERTEQQAEEFDRRFHRPFPMLYTEAARDRALARHVRAGRAIRPAGGASLLQS